MPFDVERLIGVILASGVPEPEQLISRYRDDVGLEQAR